MPSDSTGIKRIPASATAIEFRRGWTLGSFKRDVRVDIEYKGRHFAFLAPLHQPNREKDVDELLRTSACHAFLKYDGIRVKRHDPDMRIPFFYKFAKCRSLAAEH